MGLPIQHAERLTSLLSLSDSTDKRVHSCHCHRLKSVRTSGMSSWWCHVRCRFYQESKRRGWTGELKVKQCWRTKKRHTVCGWLTYKVDLKTYRSFICIGSSLETLDEEPLHIKWAVTVQSLLTHKQRPRQRSLSWLGLLSGPKSSFHIKVKFVRCFPCYLKVLIHSPLIRFMIHWVWCHVPL